MRFLVRAAVSAAAVAVAAAMAPLVPAQAAGGWSVYQEPSVQIDETFFMHKHVEGRHGNWHVLNIRIQQDDDGTLGALTDLRCPKGEAPAPNGANCRNVGGASFDDDSGLTVSYSKRLRSLQVHGNVDLVADGTDEVTPSTVNLRLHARGRFSRTVTRSGPDGSDPNEYKRVDIQRGRVSAHGHLGWLEATRAQVRNTEPLHVYWILSRIPPTA